MLSRAHRDIIRNHALAVVDGDFHRLFEGSPVPLLIEDIAWAYTKSRDIEHGSSKIDAEFRKFRRKQLRKWSEQLPRLRKMHSEGWVNMIDRNLLDILNTKVDPTDVRFTKKTLEKWQKALCG